MTRTKQLLALLVLAGAVFIHVAAQQSTPIRLRGTLVTPDEIIADGVIAIQGERIVGVGPFSGRRGDGRVFETNSFVYPGLIDLHDHITWNLLPRWTQNIEFSTR